MIFLVKFFYKLICNMFTCHAFLTNVQLVHQYKNNEVLYWFVREFCKINWNENYYYLSYLIN